MLSIRTNLKFFSFAEEFQYVHDTSENQHYFTQQSRVLSRLRKKLVINIVVKGKIAAYLYVSLFFSVFYPMNSKFHFSRQINLSQIWTSSHFLHMVTSKNNTKSVKVTRKHYFSVR